MLDTDQHSHSIIISLMITHKCFWLLHLALWMMEVVVCIHRIFLAVKNCILKMPYSSHQES